MTQTIRTIRIAAQGPAGPAGLYPQGNWDLSQVPYARSTVLAHNGGVWLSLRVTSAEPSVDVPDDWASWLDFSGMIGGFATLGDDGKIPTSQLPAIAITDTFTAASQAAMLALTAQKGDIAIRTDLNKSFVLAADDASVLANWKELLTPTDAVLSVAGLTGAIGASALKTALTIAAGDVAGLAASATTDTTNAGNIGSGTLSNARLSGVALTANNLSDLASAATARSNLGLGALALLNAGGGLTSIGGNLSANVTSVAARTGAVTLSSADISGLAYFATGTDAANLTGTLAAARLPAFAGGDVTSSAGSAGLSIGAAKVTSAMLNADVFSTAHTWSANQTHSAPLAMGPANPVTFNGTNMIAEAADCVSFYNGANAQKFYLYGTRTDVANYERMYAGYGTSTNYGATYYALGVSKAGSGSYRGIVIEAGSTQAGMAITPAAQIAFGNNAANWFWMDSVALHPYSDKGQDIGKSANRVRDLYVGRNVYFNGLPTADPHAVGQLWANSGVVTVSAG